MSRFKNALCLVTRPDLHGSYAFEYTQLCKRHKQHPPPHRVKFQDGGVREWNDGDRDTELTKEPPSR